MAGHSDSRGLLPVPGGMYPSQAAGTGLDPHDSWNHRRAAQDYLWNPGMEVRKERCGSLNFVPSRGLNIQMCLSGWSGSAGRSVSADGGAVITTAAADGGRPALVGAGGETTGTDPTTFSSFSSSCLFSPVPFPLYFLSSPIFLLLIVNHPDVYV